VADLPPDELLPNLGGDASLPREASIGSLGSQRKSVRIDRDGTKQTCCVMRVALSTDKRSSPQ
jgi:hypothetical protein